MKTFLNPNLRQHVRDAVNLKKALKMLPDSGVLGFGKFEGQSVFDIDPEYVLWAMDTIPFFESRLEHVQGLRAQTSDARPSPRVDQVPERASQGQEGPSEAQETAWRENDDDSIPSFGAGLASLAP
jgi:uncharacterized protein (DUF3820 family)